MFRKEGILLCSKGAVFGERVFYCSKGKRHLVPDLEWLTTAGFAWPSDVLIVPDAVIANFLPAQIAPKNWTAHDFVCPPQHLTSRQMREITASQLTGSGLELGALASPFPIPTECNVIYGDRYSYREIKVMYAGEPTDDLVVPSLRVDFSNLSAIGENMFDFIVASHVIEHTRDPIGAVVSAYKCLRPGGSLVLVVPDKTRTFDRKRANTPIDHLILDYVSPSFERDREDYEDFYRHAYSSEMPLPPTYSEAISTNASIHFHVWTFDSFSELIMTIVSRYAPYSRIWSQRTLPNESDDFEFYFTMTK